MKVLVETNQGVFAAYLKGNEIIVYEGDNETKVVSLTPGTKRSSVLDVSTDGVARVLRDWLETQYDRLEITRVTALLSPPGR